MIFMTASLLLYWNLTFSLLYHLDYSVSALFCPKFGLPASSDLITKSIQTIYKHNGNKIVDCNENEIVAPWAGRKNEIICVYHSILIDFVFHLYRICKQKDPL